MPRLWNDTIEAHRNAVRDALLLAVTATLTEDGPAAVTLAHVAARAGIGRATVYKYFPDVEALLDAWHDRHVSTHLAHLVEIGNGRDTPDARLAHVLEAHALHARGQPDSDLLSQLHRSPPAARRRHRLHDYITTLISAGAQAGRLRDDVPAHELASFCLSALAAARTLPTDEAVRRLVRVTLAGMAAPGDQEAVRRIPSSIDDEGGA